MEHFGLWIDQTLTSGHSRAMPLCNTFNSPMLSGKQEFEIEQLDIWGVGSPDVETNGEVSSLRLLTGPLSFRVPPLKRTNVKELLFDILGAKRVTSVE